MNDTDKKYLSDLYIAQFSGWEYTMLLLICMFYKNGQKFRNLVIKYKIFEQMSDKKISKFARIIKKEKGFLMGWSRRNFLFFITIIILITTNVFVELM